VNLSSRIELHSKIRNVEIKFDHLVIGSSLEALCYSFLNNLPFVCTRLQVPWRFDFFEPQTDLSCFYFNNLPASLYTNGGPKIVGIQKFRLWEHLYFCLNLAGLAPTGDKIQSLRIENSILKAHTANARMAKISFNNLSIFDEHELYGIDFVPDSELDNNLEVRDWFHVRSGMKHDYDCINDDSNFVNEILFYQSDRIDGAHNFKDAISTSYLTKENVETYDYSDINARFKTLQMMKNLGIRGARNGRDQKKPDRYKFYAVKIENYKREIVSPRQRFKSHNKFQFNYDPICDIIKTEHKDSYVRKITEQLSRS
jgi:hypothetical protein